MERIDAHWSRFLGVPASALVDPGIVVVAHADALHDFRGIWLFVRERSAVVSAPSEWVARLAHDFSSAVAGDLLSRDAARRALGDAAREIIGPSFQGWLPSERFRPVSSDAARLPMESAVERLRVFRSSCAQKEWEHGGIDLAEQDVWAVFQGAELAALGQLRRHASDVVDPCMITHPQHRGRGHALRLVSAMAAEAISADRLVLYQTLLANTPAVSLALRLGFEQYATLLAVRLAPDVT